MSFMCIIVAVESGCQSPIPPEANSSTSAVTQNEVMLQAAAQYIKDQVAIKFTTIQVTGCCRL